ncbi:MAG TPA: DNRLRE domain-containing protein [Clostridiales bacterium]|nr:DNRLRE domain-containing protein [Clostridiales bacterium]
MKLERLKKKKWCKFICYLIIVAFLLEIPMPAYAAINLGGDTTVQPAETEEFVTTEEPAVTEEPAATEQDLGDTPITDNEKPILPDLFGVDSENFLGINAQEEADDPQEALLADCDREILVELTDQREANVKYFRNTDGTQTASVYDHDVHYLADDGTYQDIDNSLQKMETTKGKEVLTNEENSADFTFAKDASEGNLVSINKEGYNLKWSLSSAEDSLAQDTTVRTNNFLSKMTSSNNPANVEDTVASAQYNNILTNVNLEYVLVGTELKENIILNSAKVPAQFSFVLTASASLFAKEAEGQIYFENADGETVFRMSEAIMYDANGVESTDIKVTLSTVSETVDSHQYKLTITPSAGWLKDKTRVYPVVLDPTISTTQSSAAISDAHINSESPNTNYGTSSAMVVGTNSSGSSRAYMKFTLPTQIQKSDRIVAAELGLCPNTSNPYTIFNGGQISAAPTMYMFAPTKSWDASTLTWNNKPEYNTSETIDYSKIEIVNGAAKIDWYTWDVTSIVNKWYDGTAPNYGVMIKDTESTKYSKRAYFHSSNLSGSSQVYPIINISYMNMIGLEDYWTYHTQSAGLAGTGFVNDFTGGLTTSFEDYSWDSELLSLGVSHVYNSYYAGTTQSSLNVGDGFMLSLQERIWRVVINGTELYRYTDGDGTQHYFQYIDGKWTDDSGLNLTMTMPGDGHLYVTDKQDNVRKFNSITGYLEEIKDNDGNKITIEYSGSGYLSHAYDDAGHMVTFNRDGNNRLGYISIKDRDNPNFALKQISYTYDSTGHLTQVQFPGKSTVSSSGSSGADNIAQFGYTGLGSLNSLRDTVNGMRVDYTWNESNETRRINGFMVYNASGQEESAYTMAYSSHCTRFTETKPNIGRNQVYVFNYMGQTISAQDQDGNALFCETGMSGGAKNKITFASKAQQTITNLLKNHDFENGRADYDVTGTTRLRDTVTVATESVFYGTNSLAVRKIDRGNISTFTGAYQSVTVNGGKPYTLSAYVKTSGCSVNGAVLKLEALSGSTTVKTAETDRIVSENGYMRFETTIDLSSYSAANTYTLKASFGMKNVIATAYFDSVQLEVGACSNRYNLIENGNLESSLDGTWTVENKESYDGLVTGTRNQTGNCYQFYGNADKSKKLYQTVPMKGTAGNSFVLGCWVKSTGLPNKDNGDGTKQCLGMTLKFNNTDGTATYQNLLITPTSEEWQYICANAVAKKDFSSVTLYLKFNYNRNYVWFDDVQLYKDSFGDSFMYDSKGNVISVVDKASNTASAVNNVNNDTTSYTDGKGQTYTLEYDNGSTSAKNHNLTQSTAPDGTYSKFTYDSHGNVTAAKQYRRGSTTRAISSTIDYTDNGAYKESSTDQRGLETTYSYKQNTGLLTSTSAPVGPINTNNTLTTTMEYDDQTNYLTKAFTSASNAKVEYTYEKHRLSSLQVGTDSAYLKFHLSYDNMGNCTTVSRSSSGNSTPVVLATYTYLSGRGLVSSQKFGNGQTLNYSYDTSDRLVGVTSGGNQISEYVYDSNGLLGKSYSYGGNSFVTTNQYDLADRLIRTYNSNGSGIYNVGYDKNNLMTGYNSYLKDGNANLEYTTEYVYNLFPRTAGNDDTGVDKPKTNSLKTGSTLLADTSYGYDYYGRNTTMLASAGTSDSHIKIGYAYLDVGTDKTTTLPRHMAVRYTTTDTSSAVDMFYGLSYDRAGNITNVENVYKNGTTYNEGYTYDSLSRLTGATNVDNSGDNYAYTYDDRDNIIGSTVTNNGTTTQTKAYTYATDDINRLASFSHTTNSGIMTRSYTCDVIGNPTAISETDSSDNSTRNLALTWTQGRLLSNVSDGSTLNNTYCYNAAGNISKKTLADGSYVIYHYNGGKLEYEEHFNASNVLQELLKYSYDVSGDVEYLLYKDGDFSNANAFDLYYYVRDGVDNITDIFQLREQSGSSTTVVNRIAAHYEYDPYGNILSVDKYNNDPIGDINPIRYKDYYYDLQTGWYQLTSRFYDPEVGRFVNMDSQINLGIIESNLYAYCNNNPVNMADPSGHLPKLISNIGKAIKSITKKIVNIVKSVVSPKNSIGKATTIVKVSFPTKGQPNSKVKSPNGLTEREYGPDGNAKTDTDYGHAHHHPDLSSPHHHDWEWDDEDNPTRGPAYAMPYMDTSTLGVGLFTVTMAGLVIYVYKWCYFPYGK